MPVLWRVLIVNPTAYFVLISFALLFVTPIVVIYFSSFSVVYSFWLRFSCLKQFIFTVRRTCSLLFFFFFFLLLFWLCWQIILKWILVSDYVYSLSRYNSMIMFLSSCKLILNEPSCKHSTLFFHLYNKLFHIFTRRRTIKHINIFIFSMKHEWNKGKVTFLWSVMLEYFVK